MSVRIAAVFAVCALLNACSVGVIGHGVDPRDNSGSSGAVANNNNMGVSGALNLFSGPALMDWLSKVFVTNKHEDALPPPVIQPVGGERTILEQDCSNPAHRNSGTRPCE